MKHKEDVNDTLYLESLQYVVEQRVELAKAEPWRTEKDKEYREYLATQLYYHKAGCVASIAQAAVVILTCLAVIGYYI